MLQLEEKFLKSGFESAINKHSEFDSIYRMRAPDNVHFNLRFKTKHLIYKLCIKECSISKTYQFCVCPSQSAGKI